MDKTIIDILEFLSVGRLDYFKPGSSPASSHGRRTEGENCMYAPHCHDLTLEMIYKIDGRLDVLAGDRWLDFSDRRLWVFLPGTIHSEKYSSLKSCYRMLWITVLPNSFTFHCTGYAPRHGYRVAKKGFSTARTPYGILAEISMDGKLADDPFKNIHFQTIVMHAMCYIHDNYENLVRSQRNGSQHIQIF